MAEQILTYVDACLLIAAFRKTDARNPRADAIIKDKRRTFLVSDALWMEVMPAPLRNKQHNEVAFYEDFFSMARYLPMSDAVMRRARALAARYFLDAMDAIHIAHALHAGADQFISAENATRRMFQVQEMPVLTIALK
ncbi:MAG: PIN domain-containing protein [Ottowia sp.]|nr:PIN domain-containing protein [Ottowia sp.]